MMYTVKFDLCIDYERILPEKEIEEIIKEVLNETAFTVSDFKLLDVND